MRSGPWWGPALQVRTSRVGSRHPDLGRSERRGWRRRRWGGLTRNRLLNRAADSRTDRLRRRSGNSAIAPPPGSEVNDQKYPTDQQEASATKTKPGEDHERHEQRTNALARLLLGFRCRECNGGRHDRSSRCAGGER